MTFPSITAERDHWKRIAHDRVVSANQLLARARAAESALARGAPLRRARMRLFWDRITKTAREQVF